MAGLPWGEVSKWVALLTLTLVGVMEYRGMLRRPVGLLPTPLPRSTTGCYQAGKDVGQGVQWSADRAQAWEVQDGEKGRSISLEEAAQIAARIGLPVP